MRGGISGIGQRKPRRVRNWTKAHEKIAIEGGFCRNCGATQRIECAHIVGREHDFEFPIRIEGDWRPGDVHPDRIIPLCHDCHQGPNGQHAKRLDCLPLLTLPEQLQAVADIGGISRAYDFLMPSESHRRVGRAA